MLAVQPMSAARPSEARLRPARASLNVVAAIQQFDLQAGTAIFKRKIEDYFLCTRQ